MKSKSIRNIKKGLCMIKNITFCLLTLVAFNSYCAQRAIGQDQTQNNQDDNKAWEKELLNLRVTAFRKWQDDHKDAFNGKKTDDPEIVNSYIYLTMFVSDYDNRVKDANYVTQAAKFAKQICPQYEWWDQYFQTYPKIKQGKSYSEAEQVQLALEPVMQHIVSAKRNISMLKGEEHNPDTVIDWNKEVEFVQAHMTEQDSWSMLSIMQRAMPLKMEEGRGLLNQELACCKKWKIIPLITKKNKELSELRQEVALKDSELSAAQHHTNEQVTLFNRQIQNLTNTLNESERTAQAKNARIALVHENVKKILTDWQAIGEVPVLFDAHKEIAKRDELIMRLTSLLE